MTLEAELQWMTSTINREAERRGFFAGIEAAAKVVDERRPKNERSDWTEYAKGIDDCCAALSIEIRSIEPPKGGDET